MANEEIEDSSGQATYERVVAVVGVLFARTRHEGVSCRATTKSGKWTGRIDKSASVAITNGARATEMPSRTAAPFPRFSGCWNEQHVG